MCDLFSYFSNARYYKEIVLLQQVLKYQQFNVNDVEHFITLLEAEAKNLSLPFTRHATQFVVEALFLLINKSPAADDHSDKFLLALVAQLSSKSKIHMNDVQLKLQSHATLVPIYLVMELDQLGVVSLVHYFQSCAESKEKATCWVRSLVKLACEPANNKDLMTFHYLFAAIIEIGSGNMFSESQIGGPAQKIALQVINNVIRKLWDHLWENPEKDVSNALEIPDGNSSSQPSTYFHLSSFKKCYLDQLQFLISYKPEIKASKAITSQAEWTFFKSPKNIASFVSQVNIIIFFPTRNHIFYYLSLK